jgi:hypothetical protein
VTRANRKRQYDLEHRHREIVAAVWRREQARAGRGFRFEIPESAPWPEP